MGGQCHSPKGATLRPRVLSSGLWKAHRTAAQPGNDLCLGVGLCVALTLSHLLVSNRLTVGTFEIKTWLGHWGLWILEPCTGNPGELWLPALQRATLSRAVGSVSFLLFLLTPSSVLFSAHPSGLSVKLGEAEGLLPYFLADHNLITQTATSRS